MTWEERPSASSFVRTWVAVTFRPRSFVATLGPAGSLARPSWYAAVGCTLAVLLVAGATAWPTYTSLGRFGATGSFVRVFSLQMGWQLSNLLCFLAAAVASTLLVSLLARESPVETLRTRLYTMGPITLLSAWWVMWRWLGRSQGRGSHATLLALVGLAIELALTQGFSWLAAAPMRDAFFGLLFPA